MDMRLVFYGEGLAVSLKAKRFDFEIAFGAIWRTDRQSIVQDSDLL